jgi:hypothetical protein
VSVVKRVLLLVLMPLVLGACKKGHPISVYVANDFQKVASGKTGQLVYGKIAVFPFVSALNPADDPDAVAPMTMEKFLAPELDKRTDYKFISPNTVTYAIDREGWQDRYRAFLEGFAHNEDTDRAFLKNLATVLQCDAFLIPVVDAWQKDEVDVQENSTPATYVGATLSILDGTRNPGAVLFRSTDEDYEEGARSETSSRTLVKSSSGIIRSDPGARAFAAPPFEDVAPRVIRALVRSLPAR